MKFRTIQNLIPFGNVEDNIFWSSLCEWDWGWKCGIAVKASDSCAARQAGSSSGYSLSRQTSTFFFQSFITFFTIPLSFSLSLSLSLSLILSSVSSKFMYENTRSLSLICQGQQGCICARIFLPTDYNYSSGYWWKVESYIVPLFILHKQISVDWTTAMPDIRSKHAKKLELTKKEQQLHDGDRSKRTANPKKHEQWCAYAIMVHTCFCHSPGRIRVRSWPKFARSLHSLRTRQQKQTFRFRYGPLHRFCLGFKFCPLTISPREEILFFQLVLASVGQPERRHRVARYPAVRVPGSEKLDVVQFGVAILVIACVLSRDGVWCDECWPSAWGGCWVYNHTSGRCSVHKSRFKCWSCAEVHGFFFRAGQFYVQLCTENQCNWATLMAFYTNFTIKFFRQFHH